MLITFPSGIGSLKYVGKLNLIRSWIIPEIRYWGWKNWMKYVPGLEIFTPKSGKLMRKAFRTKIFTMNESSKFSTVRNINLPSTHEHLHLHQNFQRFGILICHQRMSTSISCIFPCNKYALHNFSSYNTSWRLKVKKME